MVYSTEPQCGEGSPLDVDFKETLDPRVEAIKGISVFASIEYACKNAILVTLPRVVGIKGYSITTSIEYAC